MRSNGKFKGAVPRIAEQLNARNVGVCSLFPELKLERRIFFGRQTDRKFFLFCLTS